MDHNLSVFKLTGKHTSVACAGCHANGVYAGTPQTCNGCHAKTDLHSGRLGTSCSNCHTTAGWPTSTMDHNLPVFKLTGKHTGVACAGCHANGVYAGRPSDCNSCHAAKDFHNGRLGTKCETCHATSGWPTNTFDHNLSVYKLTGKHITLACVNCHADGVYAGRPSTCNSCHASKDLHNGRLGTNCSTCHTTAGWPTTTMDHNLSVYKLTGKHIGVACAGCHANGVYAGRPSDCNSCHASKDFHGGRLGTNCSTCHTTAGWPTSTFDHNLSVFKLTGKHVNVACAGCHADGVYAGKPQTCNSCHATKDLHSGRLGTNCSTCHTTAGWPTSIMDHNLSVFKLTGKHSSVACAGCHANGVYAGTPQTCNGCHAKTDLHSGRLGTNCANCHTTTAWPTSTMDHNLSVFKLTGKHGSVTCAGCHANGVYAGTPVTCNGCHVSKDLHSGRLGTDCVKCHTTTGWPTTIMDHNLSVYKLTGKHVSVTCAGCHADGVYAGKPQTCYACHASKDFHNGRLGINCVTCHTTAGWPTSIFDHNLSVFKLTGKHTSVACAGCHADGAYAGKPQTCYACHASKDLHGGRLGTGCATCHTTTSWPTTTFDHNLSVYKLTGKHIGVPCAGCHADGVYAGKPQTCYACHASKDLHGGRLGTNCVSCHAVTGWPTTIMDHNLSVFKLTGKHTSVACSGCHINGVYAGTPNTCNGCHAKKDLHSGRLGTNCATCHTTTAWPTTIMDHNLSVFKLTGKHSSVACAACHINGVYAGTPSTCIGCHAAKDFHNGRLGVNCATCHTTTAWPTTSFDHNLSTFKLTGKHTGVACSSCHKNGIYVGTASTCYGCHAGVDKHAGAYGTNCSTCHSTTAWLPASFDHNLSVFKLTGAHLGVACTSCHKNNVYKGTSSVCVSCHVDPVWHAGFFGTNCASCHTTTNWNAAYTGSHSKIQGTNSAKHQGAGCKDCHTVSLQAYTCIKCHDFIHP
jgi:hypothetical protein